MRSTYTISFFIALLGLFFSSAASAQCNPSIPSNAEQKDGTILHGSSDDTLWLCPGSSLDLESSFGSVDYVTVYAEENCTVRLQETDGNTGNIIYIQDNGQVEVGSNADGTDIYHASSVSITDNGTNTSTTDCGSVNFDYSNAPPDSCGAVSIDEESRKASHTEVRAIGGQVRTAIPKELLRKDGSLSIQLYNLLGKEVHTEPIRKSEMTLDPEVPAGVYLYTIRENGTALSSGKLALQ